LIGGRRGLHGLRRGEIKNDEFYFALLQLAAQASIRTILEIGSSAGDGSTEALVKGLRENPNDDVHLFCVEISRPRFKALQARYATDPFVKCYNVSSVREDRFPSQQEVIAFYTSVPTALNRYPLDEVLKWLRHDIEYLS
jgi:hypothetical protein